MMIKKKVKTIFTLLRMLLFFAILMYTPKAMADYTLDGLIKISSLTDNTEGLITGYINNTLTYNDSLYFGANILFNDDSYIYSLEKNNKLVSARASGGVTYQKDSYMFSLGLIDSVSSKNFYNNLFLQQNYQFGVKALSRLKEDRGSYYTLTDSYISNNTSLSALFLKSFLDESLYIGVSLTPSLEYFVAPFKNVHYDDNVSAFDTTIIYYDEYESLGYGFDTSLRQYLDVSKGSGYSKDIAMGISLDYFGFSFKSHYMFGNNHFELNNDYAKKYKAFENSLYYTISSFTFGAYYLNTNIVTKEDNYKTDLLEFDLQYAFSQNLIFYSAVFYQDFKVSAIDNNIGLLLGISFSF